MQYLNVKDHTLAKNIQDILDRLMVAGYDGITYYEVPNETFDSLGLTFHDLMLLMDTEVHEQLNLQGEVVRRGGPIIICQI